MNISIIYHSQSGNTKKIADEIGSSINSNKVNVKVMSVEDVDKEFVESSKAVIFGCPTYCGSYSWQMKRWFDTTGVTLEGKLGSVFVTEDYIGGGADVAELGLIGMMLVRGMLVYSCGFTKGQPFTHLGAVAIKSGDDGQVERAKILGQRVADKAIELWG